jgi:hypothetical protein
MRVIKGSLVSLQLMIPVSDVEENLRVRKTGMSHGKDVLLELFVIFFGAQIGAKVAQRLKFPAILGEITAGCILGPSSMQ